MIGLVNNCYLDFLSTRFGEEGLAVILDDISLPQDVAFVSACPYADGLISG